MIYPNEVVSALAKLKRFISSAQMFAIKQVCQSEEQQFMFDKLVEMDGVVTTMPKTYETDGLGDQAVACLHYFIAGCDWYITERDMMEVQLQAFGQANLGYGGELGYISIVEIIAAGAEIDLHWVACKLSEIK